MSSSAAVTVHVMLQGTTLRSVKHALGPSFGSLALGSAILTAVQIARQIVEVRTQRLV